MAKKQLLALLVAASFVSGLQAMVSDSRYFPWYQRFYDRTYERRSIIDVEAFFVTAGSARGNESIPHIGIPEIWGVYDEKQLSDALLLLGQTTPLLAQWQLQTKIPWIMKGKIEGQGFSLVAELGGRHGLSLCASTAVMHVTCNQQFILPRTTQSSMGLLPAQELELDSERRQINEQLGFKEAQWSKSGMCDTEVYLRYGFVKDYAWKFRKIDVGAYAGALIATGVKKDPNNPASVPFAGDGHSGFFVGAEGFFEIKEDWNVGLRMQVNSRVAKTREGRMPINNETVLYGAISGPVRIDPGATFIFTPCFRMGDLRDGWGLSVQYLLAFHGGDVWTDMRPVKTIPTTLNGLYKKSEWTAEYLAVNIFYDSDRVKSDDRVHPLLNFQWSIPLHLMAEKQVSKTNLVSLGFVFNF